jgi:hypothetical protein
MKYRIGIIIIAVTLFSCDTSTPNLLQEPPVRTRIPLEGTWELITGTIIEKGDSSVTDYTKNQKMIKIINASHFAFLRHDLGIKKDSAVYHSGGGRYSVIGDQYTEHLDFCSDRQWEGQRFQFTVSIKNDTLIQSGIEKLEKAGVDRRIIELYIRVKS